MNFQPPRKVQSYIRPAAMRRPSSQLNRLPQVRHVTEIRSWSEGVRQTKGSTHVQLIAVSLLQLFNMKKVIKIGEGGNMIKNRNIWKVSNWKVSNPQRMAAMSHDILPIVQKNNKLGNCWCSMCFNIYIYLPSLSKYMLCCGTEWKWSTFAPRHLRMGRLARGVSWVRATDPVKSESSKQQIRWSLPLGDVVKHGLQRFYFWIRILCSLGYHKKILKKCFVLTNSAGVSIQAS